MISRFCGSTLVLVVSLALLHPALADVPPPEGYVETCTVANHQTATSECLGCFTTRGMASRCEPLLTPYCFIKICHTWSGSTEIWCRTPGPGLPSVPSEILDTLTPDGFPLPPASDGGTVAAPNSCLPYRPADAGASGPDSSDDRAEDNSGCAVGGWVSTKAFGPWLVAGLFATMVVLRRRRQR